MLFSGGHNRCKFKEFLAVLSAQNSVSNDSNSEGAAGLKPKVWPQDFSEIQHKVKQCRETFTKTKDRNYEVVSHSGRCFRPLTPAETWVLGINLCCLTGLNNITNHKTY